MKVILPILLFGFFALADGPPPRFPTIKKIGDAWHRPLVRASHIQKVLPDASFERHLIEDLPAVRKAYLEVLVDAIREAERFLKLDKVPSDMLDGLIETATEIRTYYGSRFGVPENYRVALEKVLDSSQKLPDIQQQTQRRAARDLLFLLEGKEVAPKDHVLSYFKRHGIGLKVLEKDSDVDAGFQSLFEDKLLVLEQAIQKNEDVISSFESLSNLALENRNAFGFHCRISPIQIQRVQSAIDQSLGQKGLSEALSDELLSFLLPRGVHFESVHSSTDLSVPTLSELSLPKVAKSGERIVIQFTAQDESFPDNRPFAVASFWWAGKDSAGVNGGFSSSGLNPSVEKVGKDHFTLSFDAPKWLRHGKYLLTKFEVTDRYGLSASIELEREPSTAMVVPFDEALKSKGFKENKKFPEQMYKTLKSPARLYERHQRKPNALFTPYTVYNAPEFGDEAQAIELLNDHEDAHPPSGRQLKILGVGQAGVEIGGHARIELTVEESGAGFDPQIPRAFGVERVDRGGEIVKDTFQPIRVRHFTPVEGQENVWEIKFVVPFGAVPGRYRLTELFLRDKAGNSSWFEPKVEFDIVGEPRADLSDRKGPRVYGLEAGRESANSETGGYLYIKAFDDQSGLRSLAGEASPAQDEEGAGIEFGGRLVAKEMDGWYRVKTMPSPVSGQYRIRSFRIFDELGNDTTVKLLMGSRYYLMGYRQQ